MKTQSEIKSVFSPIELKITIESQLELEILYQLFNNKPKNISTVCRDVNGNEFPEQEIDETMSQVFSELSSLRKENQLF